MDFECLARCCIVNLRTNLLPHILAALLLTALTPVIFSLSSLNGQLAAQPLEMYLSLTGMLLMTPVFLPEQNENIRDVVRVRKVSYLMCCALRLLCMIVLIAAVYACITLVLRGCESQAGWQHFAGGTVTAVFLGSVGVAAAGISGNTIIGYMAAMVYYALNFSLGRKLGAFYLFSMSASGAYSKLWFLAGTAVLLSGTFAWLRCVKKL